MKNKLKEMSKKEEHYSNLKSLLRFITLGLAIWALIIAYQAKSTAEWVNDKQDNVIEQVLFKTK